MSVSNYVRPASALAAVVLGLTSAAQAQSSDKRVVTTVGNLNSSIMSPVVQLALPHVTKLVTSNQTFTREQFKQINEEALKNVAKCQQKVRTEKGISSDERLSKQMGCEIAGASVIITFPYLSDNDFGGKKYNITQSMHTF